MTATPDDAIAPLDERGDTHLSETTEPDDPIGTDREFEERSLFEDVENLIDDGKTYLEAEIGYQKTRAAFMADRAKSAVIYGAIGAAFAFLALIGLTVGLIIALAPVLTAWGSSALVVGLLTMGAVLSVRAAGTRWNSLMSVLETDRGPGEGGPP